MFTKDLKIAVIGAGIAGLATATRLAAMGHKVELYEKNSRPGGKMSEIRLQGFRFDTGPSLFTMPGWLEEIFTAAGERMEDHLVCLQLDPVCRYFYEDGTVIDAFSDPLEFAGELELKAGEKKEDVLRYLKKSERIFNVTNPVFLQSSIHKASNYLSRTFARTYLSIPSIHPFEKLHRFNRKSFKNEKTIQIFDRFATYNGSNPYKTPATLSVISHLEHNLGAYFPTGGIYSISASLERIALKSGVKISYNAEVEQILVKNDKIAGIRVGSEELHFDMVVSDIDVYQVYTKLLGRNKLPKIWFDQARSTSALIFFWGMSAESPGMDVHNILFSGNYPEEFHYLFDRKEFYDDPTVYIFISSKIVKQDAPEGKENWFVMVNVPENVGQDWDRIVEEARNRIKQKIERVTGIHPDQHIEFEKVIDPRSIEEGTSSYHGSLYGNSSNSMWAAFRRHPNFMPGLKGLFLVGGSVHPGGGIPLCLSSAKIVSNLILNSSKKR